MTFEFKDNTRHRRLLLITIGGVLAASAGVAAFTMASNGKAPKVATQAVLVAGRDVAARTAVSSDDVTLRDVPVDQVLGQTYTDAGQVVGRITSVPILPGQQITPNLFATSNANSDFSILGPGDTVTATSPYWRAIAIKIPKERAVGGEVAAGDFVDLVVSIQIDLVTQAADGTLAKCDVSTETQFQCGISTKVTFLDIEVLKASTDDDTYVFKMNLQQAEQASHVIQEAPDSFTMLLRPAEDTRAVDTSQYGTTDDRLIMTYLYPAPQWVDVTKLVNPPVPYGTPTPSGAPATTEPASSLVPSTSPGAESPAPSVEPSATPAP